MYKTEKQVLVDIQTPKPRISKYSYKTIGSGTNERTNISLWQIYEKFLESRVELGAFSLASVP